jgi:hypothetical protein
MRRPWPDRIDANQTSTVFKIEHTLLRVRAQASLTKKEKRPIGVTTLPGKRG